MAVTIISGGRYHEDPAIIGAAVKASGFVVTKIIEGGQRTYDEERKPVGGIDYLARVWGEGNGIPVQTVEADWKKYGRAAGPIRNAQMLEEGAEQLIAIPGPESVGTWDMVGKAKRRGLPFFVYRP